MASGTFTSKPKIIDPEWIKNNTPNLQYIPITLRKTKLKGTGVYATRFIPKNTVVALYRMKVFAKRTYESPTNFMYTFNVYTKTGKESSVLIGDLDLDEVPLPPVGTVPYWAHFANEPSGKQTDNVFMDNDPDGNYRDRARCKVGSHIVYKMITNRDIKPGEELVWSYGEKYERNY